MPATGCIFSALGRVGVLAVAVSFTKAGVSPLNPQFGFLSLRYSPTEVDGFALGVELASEALIALSTNTPFVAVSDDILVFSGGHIAFLSVAS